jgi:hypothetical protein
MATISAKVAKENLAQKKLSAKGLLRDAFIKILQ